MLKIYKIESRRYIGSKTKLIEKIMNEIDKDSKVVADLFAGTGVVSKYLLSLGKKVIINDMLFSNYIVYEAFFGKGNINTNKLKKIIKGFNNLDSDKLDNNYISNNYGNRYFSHNNAKKIGFIRDQIDTLFKDKKINKQEKYILISSLMYSMDRFANTVGHYEMFLKKEDRSTDFEMGIIDISQRGSDVELYNMDANKLASKIKADIVYLDPPYNSRQYINFYHVWENIAKNDKPELKWESKKFDRSGLRSDYSKSSAPMVMQKLCHDIRNTRKIIVSYNNTYKAQSVASNNKISIEEMKNIFSNNRNLKINEIAHQSFNSGKTDFKNHIEYLYISEI